MEKTDERLDVLLLKDAIAVANGDKVIDYWGLVAQLDHRVVMIEEQIADLPVVPVELQDGYRQEIDGLTLENMQLCGKLDQTREALERARAAYKEEMSTSRMLASRLQDLEKRLEQVLNGSRR